MGLSDLDKLNDSLRKKYGDGVVMDLSKSGATLPDVDRVPLDNPDIAALFGKEGVPIGRVVEIYGEESSGKTSLCEYIAGQFQKYDFAYISNEKTGEVGYRKGVVVYIDTENAIDLEYAKKHGFDVNKAILVQPDNGEEGLDIAITYAESGLVDLIVIDSIAALTPRAIIEGDMDQQTIGLQARMLSKFFGKAVAIFKKNNVTLLCINQTRTNIGAWAPTGSVPTTTTGGKALRFYSSIRIEVKRKEFIMDKDDMVGLMIGAKTVKNKTAPPMIKRLLRMTFENSFESTMAWIDLFIKYNFVEMAGAGWAKLPNGEKVQGRDNIKEYFMNNKEEFDSLVEKCRKIISENTGSRVSVDEEEL